MASPHFNLFIKEEDIFISPRRKEDSRPSLSAIHLNSILPHHRKNVTGQSERETIPAAPTAHCLPVHTGKKDPAGVTDRVIIAKLNYRAALAFSTTAAKAAVSLIAISDRLLRFSSMPAFLMPFMKVE